MANSPFDFFRRYTGTFMVALTVLLMVAFGFGDFLLGSGSGGGSNPNAGKVAVSWDGGELTEEQLGGLVLRRQVLASFLQQVLVTGYQTAVAEGAIEPQPLVQPLSLPSTPEQGVERDVVITKIYADAAREAGVVVGDETIREYLSDLGYRKVTKAQMRQILAAMGGPGGRRITIDYVFDLLRDAMLARNYDRSYYFTSATTLPQQKWRDWLRVNDRVIVEAAAFRATDFLSEVADPTDAELTAYFDEHKEAIPAPQRVDNVELPSPNPAFSSPRRVVVQYAKLDLEKEIDRLLDTVTDGEIEKFYNENKDRFVRTDSGFDEGFLGEAPEEDGAESGADGLIEDDGTAEDGDAEEPAGESEAAEPVGDDNAGAPETEQSGGLPSASPFRLAAYQPGEETTTAEVASGEAASETTDLSGTEALFGPDSEPDSEPDSDNDVEDVEVEAPADSDSATDTTDEATDEATDEKPVEYLTLEEASDDIRRSLAQGKAVQQMPDRMAEIVAPLKEAFDDYFIKLIDAREEGGDLPELPEALTRLKEFAEENGLEFAETADLSIFEMRDSAIGATRDFTQSVPRSGEPMPLYGRVFGESGVDLYEPVLTFDVTFDSNRNVYPLSGYIVVKTRDDDRKTPKLEDVRPDVVRAWKLSKAADLALAKAEETAEKAQGQGLSLKDFLAGEPGVVVGETDPFSWLTQGQFSPTARRIPLRMSQPEPIESAGPDFMKAVFELEPNAIGAAMNHDKSVAYAVRVVQHLASRSELKSDFLSLGQIQYQLYGFDQAYVRQASSALVRDLLGGDEDGETSLDWKREPDEVVSAEG